MRRIEHPGLPHAQRMDCLPVDLVAFDVSLPVGASLMQTVAASMTRLGVHSAAFRLCGGGFETFSYVMPARSKSSAHAVYFSDTYPVIGPVKLAAASVTYGQRDAKPWLHSHAIWTEQSGRRHCGHLLPDDIVIGDSIQAKGVGLIGAEFTVTPDPETNFSLFKPRQASRALSTARALPGAYALRVAPNVDLCTALEAFCVENNIRRATVQGGVGSTVGAVFNDGRIVEPFVTEVLIREGSIQTSIDGQAVAELDVSLIDYLGGVSEGRFARGSNPVLVTFELVLEVLERA